ncbi:MAG: hypothetical protein GY841_17995 [FCB group bacterium]|nr:hypothetical protein [FCB group bacterium]
MAKKLSELQSELTEIKDQLGADGLFIIAITDDYKNVETTAYGLSTVGAVHFMAALIKELSLQMVDAESEEKSSIISLDPDSGSGSPGLV